MNPPTTSRTALTEALNGYTPPADIDTTDTELQAIADSSGLPLIWNGHETRWSFVVSDEDPAPVASVTLNTASGTFRIEHHDRPVPDREGALRPTGPEPDPAKRQVCDYSGVSTADLLVLWRAVGMVPGDKVSGLATSAVGGRLRAELDRRPSSEVDATVKALALD